jgi:hypothetical protein
MSPRCYPIQWLFVSAFIGAATLGALFTTNTISPEHIALFVWGVLSGLLLAGVLEIGVVQTVVRILRAVQHGRRSNGH